MLVIHHNLGALPKMKSSAKSSEMEKCFVTCIAAATMLCQTVNAEAAIHAWAWEGVISSRMIEPDGGLPITLPFSVIPHATVSGTMTIDASDPGRDSSPTHRIYSDQPNSMTLTIDGFTITPSVGTNQVWLFDNDTSLGGRDQIQFKAQNRVVLPEDFEVHMEMLFLDYTESVFSSLDPPQTLDLSDFQGSGGGWYVRISQSPGDRFAFEFGGGVTSLTPISDPTAIPEPTSLIVWSLLGLSCMGACYWRRGRKAVA